jgi:hypothetical protein
LIGTDIKDNEPRDAEGALGMVEKLGNLARGSSVAVAQLNRWQSLELSQLGRAASGRHDRHPFTGKASYQRRPKSRTHTNNDCDLGCHVTLFLTVA